MKKKKKISVKEKTNVSVSQARFNWNNPQIMKILLIGGFILFGLMRIMYPAADPPNSLSWSFGPWGDESYYTRNAVNKVIHDAFIQDVEDGNPMLVNTLYTLFTYVIFLVFGVGYIQAKIISITVAMVGLWFLYLLVRDLFGKGTALLAVYLAGLNYTFIMFNRIILQETHAIMWVIISLYLLRRGRTNRWFLAASGAVGFIAFISRAFAAYYLMASTLTWVILLVVDWKQVDERKRVFMDAVWFYGGMLATVVVWLVTFVLPFSPYVLESYYKYTGTGTGASPLNPDNIAHLGKVFKSILGYFHNPLVKNMPLTMLLSFCSIPLFLFTVRGRKELRSPVVVQLFTMTLIWSLLLAVFLPHKPIRRYLYFIPQVSVLAAYVLHGIFTRRFPVALTSRKEHFLIGAWLFVGGILFTATLQQLPGMAELFKSINQGVFPWFAGATRDLAGSYAYFTTMAIFSLIFSALLGLLFIKGGRTIVPWINNHGRVLPVSVIIMCVFIGFVQLRPYALWVSSHTYSVYRGSKKIASLLTKDDVVVGNIALSLESDARFFSYDPKWGMNTHVFDKFKVTHVMISNKGMAEILQKDHGDRLKHARRVALIRIKNAYYQLFKL